MSDFFQTNRNIVYFIYGETFFVLGLAIALQSRKHSQLGLARYLWLLASFGFIHSMYEWGAVFIPIQQTYLAESAIDVLRIGRLILEVVSFLMLFQFGVELIVFGSRGTKWRMLPTVMLLTWGASVLVSYFATVTSFGEFLDVGDTMARYLLAVPGGVAVAWGLSRQAEQVVYLGLPRIARYLRGAAWAFVFYAAMSAIVPRGDFFPASVFNYDNLVAIVGVPAQIFRAACGIVIAYLIIRGLEIFDVETDRLIEETAHAHAVAADRERIGRELHDSIIQSLYGAGLTLEDASVTMKEDLPYAKKRIDQVAGVLNRTIRDIRSFILDLRHDFDGGNWRADLGELVRSLRLQTLIDTEFVVAGIPTWEPSDDESKEILAIAHGALMNVARHARATRVCVTLTYRPKQIEVEISDNGVGFVPGENHDGSAPGEHQGLANMRARAELIEASFGIDSTPYHGTVIHLVLPNKRLEKEESYAAQDHAR